MTAHPQATPVVGRRPVLVTGGAGFIGANLADRLAAQGHDVLVFDALRRSGVDRNLAWLRRRHPARITAVVADVRDEADISAAVQDSAAIFHLAAQVAVTASLQDPLDDFTTNLAGTMQILEAIRRCGRRIPLVFASTNKVYGSLSELALRCEAEGYAPVDPVLRRFGIGEDQPLSFRTPYGCSKGAADQYVLEWCRTYAIPSVVFRMSCIYGPRQLGTEDQGWLAHFVRSALQRRPVTIFGDGNQVRDVLHVGDAVGAYVAAWQAIDGVAGQAFNLGGGPANAVSLRQVLDHIADAIGHRTTCHQGPWREEDQRYYVSDIRRIRAALGLAEPMAWRQGVLDLIDWVRRHDAAAAEAEAPVAARGADNRL